LIWLFQNSSNSPLGEVLALTDLARKMEVNIFRRFELMKGWHEIEEVSFDLMVDPGDPPRLHDSNWSTQRLTGTLKDQIVSGVAMALAAQKSGTT
jgi:hypothetical protein